MIFSSCDDTPDIDEEKFIETYKEILITRESTIDSVEANKIVSKIIKDHGYSEASFRKEFFELASEREVFLRVIDSLRESVKRDMKMIDNKKHISEQDSNETVMPDSSK